MFDSNLYPYLIEVNASPSFTAENAIDYHLKYNVLNDFFNIIDIENDNSSETDVQTRYGGFDLVYYNNNVVLKQDATTTVYQPPDIDKLQKSSKYHDILSDKNSGIYRQLSISLLHWL